MRNRLTGKERKISSSKRGYSVVSLRKNGKFYLRPIHRLLAELFIPNPDGKPEINHIDEDPSNNVVSNLEWCTHKYNSTYGGHNKRISEALTNGKLSKAVIATLPDGTVERYPSQGEAARQLKCSQGRISDACRGVIPTYHHGRRWSYADQ